MGTFASVDAISDAGVGILAVEEGLVEVFATERAFKDNEAHWISSISSRIVLPPTLDSERWGEVSEPNN
jgi:hypothetical protein